MRELDDEDCLADAAAVLAARQLVDPLLLRLTTQPFDVDAVGDLRRWIDEVFPLAAPAWLRLLGLPAPAALAGSVQALTSGSAPGSSGSAELTGLYLVSGGPGSGCGRRHDDAALPATSGATDAAGPAGTSP